ncbi:MAG: tRNA 2-thiouridine(34) synthase MnmA [Lachnospiraceae bacterium]|nr:tRNA 2-thiouridine(34) synthase MnmA [Lachnospiraceae bacterium]
MDKVMIGMSGGVDSAVTAYLLKEAGYEVIGVSLCMLRSQLGADGKPMINEDAQKVASSIGIEFLTVPCVDEFEKYVTNPFIEDYVRGLTPNPCIECNRYIKWEMLVRTADKLGAGYVGTGHYASVIRLENGRYTVKKAVSTSKDQTYMLYRLSQEQLSRTLMPLGDHSKDEVREIARNAGLVVANKPDSQEICFVPDDDYARYIKENAPGKIPGEGNFVDEDGRILGRHKGIIHYTVGQRKGLGISMGVPVYVSKICPDTDEVVLGTLDSVRHKVVECSRVNYMGICEPSPGEKNNLFVKIRYHHEAKPAVVETLENDCVRIVFDEEVKAPAPGQSAVFYDENGCVAGGGIITSAK